MMLNPSAPAPRKRASNSSAMWDGVPISCQWPRARAKWRAVSLMDRFSRRASQRRTGVFGIKIYFAVQQGRMGDQGGTEFGSCLRLDARAFQGLSVYLGDDELLGEILASHSNDLRIRGHREEGRDDPGEETRFGRKHEPLFHRYKWRAMNIFAARRRCYDDSAIDVSQASRNGRLLSYVQRCQSGPRYSI